MNTVASRVEVARPVAAEDAARADFYALLAALFHHAPDARLLRTLAIAAPIEGGDAALAGAWSQLVAASGVVDEEAVAEEYETLFVGVGKARVSVYAGWYEGQSVGTPARVRILEHLASLGLARPAGVSEPEDH